MPIINYLYFFIDEFSALRIKISWLWWKELEELFINNLVSILNVARSYWIYLAFATQFPQADKWIDTRLVANLRTKILWKVANAQYVS